MRMIRRLAVIILLVILLPTSKGCGPTKATLAQMQKDAPAFEEGAAAYLREEFGDDAELISIAPVSQNASPSETDLFREHYYGNAEGTFFYRGARCTIYGHMEPDEATPSFWTDLPEEDPE